MLVRNLGQRSGEKVSPVSIGAMRFPRDVMEAVAIIRHAIDSGMRYIDTSRGYGESEWILGQALKDGYRQKVLLSTKCSPWITKIQPGDLPTADCTRRRIEESIQRLGVDYLDFYQLWNVDSREHYEQATAKGGMVDGLIQAKKDGLIKHAGFTTHDNVPDLLTYIEEADWCDVILFTYNLLNRKYAPAIAAAHRKGIGTIVMNPVGGGKLTQESPVLSELARQVGCKSVPDLAIRYIMTNSDIDTLLCGMTKLSDVDDTVASANQPLTADQLAQVEACIQERAPEKTGFCTTCRYCLPCPKGIDIPGVMGLVYDDRCWGLKDVSKRHYNWIKPKASECVACGKCEEKCTQKLKIMTDMVYAAQEYGDKQK